MKEIPTAQEYLENIKTWFLEMGEHNSESVIMKEEYSYSND